MSKFELKEKAIQLRRKGKTYSEILKEIPVAKSTVSLWLLKVGLSIPQKQRITAKRIAGQKRGAEAQRAKRIKIQEEIIEKSRNQIANISNRELWLIGTALYWAEGSKARSYRVSQRVSFSNSDHEMITIFILWLQRCLHVPVEKIQCDLYVHETHKYRLKEIIKFWSDKTGFSTSHFKHVYFKKTPPKKSYRKNTGLLYNGLLRVNIASSTSLNRSITGLIQGIVKNCGIV